MRQVLKLLAIQAVMMNVSVFAAENPIIINDSKWPPYFFGSKEMKGFGKEVLHSCLNEMNIPHKFKFHPIKRMRASMERGTIDINVYSYKESRESFLHYGKEPIFESSYNPIVLADSPIKINSIADFDKYKLGHQIGLRYSNEFHEYIQNRKKNRNLDEATSNESNLKKLLQKRIDVFVGTKASITILAKQLKVLDKIKILNYNVRLSKYFVALSKKTPRVGDPLAFLTTVDQCIKKRKASSEYCKIAEKYSLPCSLSDAG